MGREKYVKVREESKETRVTGGVAVWLKGKWWREMRGEGKETRIEGGD